MDKPTPERRDEIRKAGQEARVFLNSYLYSQLQKWIGQEQYLTIQAIVTDARQEKYKNMNREQFVERMCGYFESLPTLLAVFKGFVEKEQDLLKLEEQEKNESTG